MSLELLDSHAHLGFEAYQEDLGEVLDRSWQAGVTQIVTIGLGVEGAREAVRLAGLDRRIWATVGIHPHEADLGVPWQGDPAAAISEATRESWESRKESTLSRLSRLAEESRVVAIGEVGLDYHYDHSPRRLQQDLFREFIRLARSTELPLVVHSREAEEDTIRILREEGAEKAGGVIHCYGGDQELGDTALELGFFLGLAGPLTFKNATSLRKAAARLPLERLLVETDCPYLAPEPFRGKRNEPAYVAEVVKTLAKVRGLPVDKVGQTTAENAKRLFRIG
jgi:TatD DNase family protein